MDEQPCQRSTPDDVVIRTDPRPPVEDPTLGIAVAAAATGSPRHRLVTIGDSVSHGFMSGAVFRTDISWPAVVATELGLSAGEFRFPTYEWPGGPGGLPLDLERLAREFEARFGPRLDWWEIVSALRWVRSYMDGVEDHWERGDGSAVPPTGEPFHNMAVFGWDVLDAALLTDDLVTARIDEPRDDLFDQVVENAMDRAGRTVLRRCSVDGRAATVVESAAAMAADPDGGIETLVVMLGANNALGSVVGLHPCWTPEGYGDHDPDERLAAKGSFNVWRPTDFAADWAVLETALRSVGAQHVIVATVPSVTIAPIARGVSGKVRPRSRYFPYYTRPWIPDDQFDPRRDPHLTEDEARAIDSAIDAYNETIIDSVRRARIDGLDWLVFDLGALLDRLAVRRYVDSPWARPPWWTPYPLPPEITALDPVPDTRFFAAGPDGRTAGGWFSLDGVHPTSIGYGIVAQEIIALMDGAGVRFHDPSGNPRPSPVTVDMARVVTSDTLVGHPPASISPTLGLMGWLDEVLDWTQRILPFTPNPL